MTFAPLPDTDSGLSLQELLSYKMFIDVASLPGLLFSGALGLLAGLLLRAIEVWLTPAARVAAWSGAAITMVWCSALTMAIYWLMNSAVFSGKWSIHDKAGWGYGSGSAGNSQPAIAVVRRSNP